MIAASLDEIMDVLTGVTVTVTLPGKREKKKKRFSRIESVIIESYSQSLMILLSLDKYKLKKRSSFINTLSQSTHLLPKYTHHHQGAAELRIC